MKLEDRDKINKIVSIILLFLWSSLIFYFSNQAGDNSNNSSNFVINILNVFLKLFSKDIDITKYVYISLIIRKLAHMFLYFILYLLSYYVLSSYKIKRKYIFSLLFCLLYAISDEIHQLFIVERSFSIIDIFIDFLGSLIGYSLLNIKKIIK